MTRERNEVESKGMTRRGALLAAGAGGLSMMGFCSACEAGENKLDFGASTPTKNISKLGPNNPIIQQVVNAASLFQIGNLSSGVQVSTDHVVSRIQVILH